MVKIQGEKAKVGPKNVVSDRGAQGGAAEPMPAEDSRERQPVLAGAAVTALAAAAAAAAGRHVFVLGDTRVAMYAVSAVAPC